MSISARVETMSKIIKENIVSETNDNVLSSKMDKSVYEKTLPDNLTMDTVLNVRHHDADFCAASAMAWGEVVLDAFENNTKLTEAHATFGIGGRDKVEHFIKKEKEYTNQFAEGGPKKEVKYGSVSTNLSLSAGKNSGDLKAVYNTIRETFTEKFGG